MKIACTTFASEKKKEIGPICGFQKVIVLKNNKHFIEYNAKIRHVNNGGRW